MMRSRRPLRPILIGATVALLFSAPAVAAVHLWEITEAYTNADGTIQFIEFFTAFNLENSTNGVPLTSNSTSGFTLTGNLVGNTMNTTFLVATSGLAAVSGFAPDFVMPDNFIAVTGGDILTLVTADTVNFGSGLLPTDGVGSLTFSVSGIPTPSANNSPRNFAGQTVSLNVPPLVPSNVFVDFSAGAGGFGTQVLPFGSLQEAIDVASAGATINLMSGTTTDTFSGVMFPVISKELTLVKIPGGGTVIIGASARTEDRSGFQSRPFVPRSSRSGAP